MNPPRFWRWYRALPIMAMLLVAGLCIGVEHLPGTLARRFLVPVDHREAILESSERHGVDPRLVCAIIKCESNWNANAQSDAGAQGLMQLMPDTSSELAMGGVVDGGTYDPANLFDPTTNIEYGSAYLGELYGLLGSTDEVIAAYNAGPGSVSSWLEGGDEISNVIAYPETAVYLVSVQETYKRYQDLYTETLSER